MSTQGQIADLDFEYADRLVTEQLGKNQYSNPISALTELICNSFDADATEVNIQVNENELKGLKNIVIADNGKGINEDILRNRFAKVGVEKNQEARFGKFGVGRFAVFKIGSSSQWESVFKDGSHFKQLSFQLIEELRKIGQPQIDTAKAKSTGTTITISNIAQKEEKNLSAKKIEDGMMTHFFSFLLTSNKNISVNGVSLDISSKIKESSDEHSSFEHDGKEIKFSLKHIVLDDSWKGPRNKNNIHFCLKGRLISSESLPFTAPKEYMALVESDYFDEIISSSRESLAGMDEVFIKIKELCKAIAYEKSKTLSESLAKEFLESARGKSFYPYSNTTLEPTQVAERAIYDVVLEKVHEEINLENCTEKHQRLIFKLIKRSLKNANLLEVLNEILNLKDEDLDRFKKVLSKTTLEQIIKLSDEITSRLQFLDHLHNIVYGDESKHIKERAHLHKILEKHPWIFGDQYHLSTSDKSFRTVIQKHRASAELPPVNEEDLAKITEYNKIPDLCFISKRDYPINPKHHNLLVEIKAPKVPLKQKELGQIKGYGNIILKSPDLPKESNHWDLFLISSDIGDDIEMEVNQKDRPRGLVNEQPNMKIWVLRWSDIIQKAKDEMTLVREHLKLTSEEMSTVDYIKEEFPFIDTTSFQEEANVSKEGQ